MKLRRIKMNLLKDEEALFTLVNDISWQFFHRPFKHRVKFNHRLRTTGGRYIPTEKLIELNPKYVIELGISELVGIIKHELCHYHLHIQGKGYQHGDDDFKALLKETGSPRYCRPLPSSQKTKKHIYTCHSCKHQYQRIRRVNVKKYRCGKCGGKIRLLNE